MTAGVGTPQLPRDSQKEAMRLTMLVDTLNSKIASQQTSLDVANSGIAALKRQISTEKTVADREITRLQNELHISKDGESDLRTKISTVLKTNEAIKLQKVVPLQTQVASLEEQVADLSIKLAERPLAAPVVQMEADTSKIADLENELERVTAHRDVLEVDVCSMRTERNVAMEHVMSMTLAMETGCWHEEERESESEGDEGEESEEGVATTTTTTTTTTTSTTSATSATAAAVGDIDGGERCCNCGASPGSTHALSAVVHAGTAAGGLPKRCPGQWPSLSQMQALTAASSAGDATDRATAENNAHLTSLIRGVRDDLYSVARRVQTTRMEQSGETKESIESYFAGIEKARNEAAVAAGA